MTDYIPYDDERILIVNKVYHFYNFELDDIIKAEPTQHFSIERQKRRDEALNRLLDKDDYLDCVMSVDRGHPEGCELHCITHSGLIFVLNEDKFLITDQPCLITILNARVGQLVRYGSENYQPDEYTLQKGREHEKNGDNEI
ncbi:MAG: hypothetical protein E7496_06485 [Ruminococcus sp.]|nr:hypothetical protein [Ruminococcus sp.]